MRIESGIGVFLFLGLVGVIAAHAQQRGLYLPGQQGLNSGLLPDPGITYANLTVNYSADTLRNGSGGKVPLIGTYNIWAVENLFFYVPNFKVAGEQLSFMPTPTFANGSATLGSWSNVLVLPAKRAPAFPARRQIGLTGLRPRPRLEAIARCQEWTRLQQLLKPGF